MNKFRRALVCLGATLLLAMPAGALNKHILVGYWHNFNNGAANGLKLSSCPAYWDVINLSFGEPTSSTDGNIVYNPTADNIYASEAEFAADVKTVQARGQKVVLSIGGANGQVRLETTEARDKFISTVENICKTYDLDGLDVDFEGQSMSFNSGDYDLANPTTPVIYNLIYALKKICADMGDDFLLTFAPETFFVQQGYSYYGSTCWGCDARAGSFLPVLYALKDRLSWLQVQYYNSGVIPSPWSSGESCGTEAFVVNLARMLLEGFTIANQNKGLTGPTSFPALRQDQVVLGVPSVTGSAGSGVLTTDQYKSIADQLRALGYTDLRGFMTWSINWDEQYSKSWSTPMAAYIAEWNGASGSTSTGDSGTSGDSGSSTGSNTGDSGSTGSDACNLVSSVTPSFKLYTSDWSNSLTGSVSTSGSSYTFTFPSATSDTWMLQPRLVPASSVNLTSGTEYTYSMTLTSSESRSGVYVKLEAGESSSLKSDATVDLTANVAKTVSFTATAGSDLSNVYVVLGLGGNSAGATLTVSDLVIKQASCGTTSGGDTASGDTESGSTSNECDSYTKYDSSVAYNVYGEHEGVKIVYNNNIYTIAQGSWAPAGATPDGTYSYLWTLVGACGSTSGSGDSGDTGGDTSGDVTNDRVLTSCLKKHLLIGYWHNFKNGAGDGLTLANSNQAYDFLNVSFAETGSDRAVITFTLDNSIYANDAAFIADIKTCQARGQKILLSIGGQNGIISISSESDKTKFVNSVIAIIDKYGFDGLDIDFEGSSAGGYTTTDATNLIIKGIREVCEHYGSDFILTMAPETAYVQAGVSLYSVPAYLTMIDQLRDILTVLHVQLYNTGSMLDINGTSRSSGNADFLVSMCDMLLQGFTTAGGTKFKALDQDQVAIGVPSCSGAAGSGIVSVADMQAALRYLITGVKGSGMSYTMKASSYPNFRGLMTWSVNWDSSNSYALANGISSLYDEIGNELVNCGETEADTEKPTAPADLKGTPAQTTIALTWTASSDNKAVKGYNIYVGDTKVGTSTTTSYTATGLTASTTYSVSVEAYDAAGNKSAKVLGSFTTLEASSETGGDGETGGDSDTGGDTSACTDPEWDSSKNYQTPGEKVSYNGKVYSCLVYWSTAGAAPDVTTAQWEYLYECGEGGESYDPADNPDTGIDYENGKRFVVYFPNWGTYNSAHLNCTVGMMPWDKITHINHAFYTVSSSNTLVSTDDFADLEKSFDHSEGWDKTDRLAGHLGEYKYYKSQYPAVKVLISVGGWTRGENFHSMASTKEGRTTFINSCVEFMQKYAFIDGIDIDWEYPGVDRDADTNDSADRGCPGGPEDGDNYVALLKEMREAFDAAGFTGKLITIAASINQNTIAKGANPSRYHQYCDIINLMSYDAHGAFERITNHHAPIYPNPNDPAETDVEKAFNAQDAANYFLSCGVPQYKLTIGSPWYSRGWKGVEAGSAGDGLFQKATGYITGTWDDSANPTPGGQFPWWYIKSTFETSSDWKKYYDNVSQAPYLYRASDGAFLTYEDETSLAARCDFVKANNLGGIIVWEISGDDLNGNKTLTNIVYDKLYKNTTEVEEGTSANGACRLFPNPATDWVYLNAPAAATVRVYATSGQLLLTMQVEEGVTPIQVSGLDSGLYILSVDTDASSEVFKLKVY